MVISGKEVNLVCAKYRAGMEVTMNELKQFFKQWIAISTILVTMAIFYSASNTASASALEIGNSISQSKTTDTIPQQLNVHIGEDASNSVNITYTTKSDTAKTTAAIHKTGDFNIQYIDGTSRRGCKGKYFHSIQVEGLSPDTQYDYTVGEGNSSYSGTFKTALPKGSSNSFRFGYIADPQVSDACNAKALGATLEKIKERNYDFVYLAGDITDTASDESQWELLFKNNGKYPEGGQDLFSSTLISVTQGNHDNSELSQHIHTPAQAGDIVYSFDYGCAKFIILNSESAGKSKSERTKQTDFLRKMVSEAKADNQWVIVGFHKAIYSGASHIVDRDIIKARKYWSPILSNLNVDLVLQGHDHVYSRGFITDKGKKNDPSAKSDGSFAKPDRSPLYVVGGHAGGLKWYSKIPYSVARNDPLTKHYSFLDINSADTHSDQKKEQTFIEFEMDPAHFTMNTYMFKYNTKTDSITTDTYLYDSITLTKNIASPANP
jgi:3',5'-cyclic AMP phosphodiesterase CpdA